MCLNDNINVINDALSILARSQVIVIICHLFMKSYLANTGYQIPVGNRLSDLHNE